MPLYAFLCTGVPQISQVPVTTQDEDKSGKAITDKILVGFCGSLCSRYHLHYKIVNTT